MSPLLLLIALLLACADWLAVARGWTRLGYFTKPAVMVALLAWLGQAGGLSGQLIWFAAGLLLSMLGDIFLMLPREQFIAGLIAFLLAHLAYLAGFNAGLPPMELTGVVLALLVGLTAAQIYRRILAGLKASGKLSYKYPILIYSTVISLMLLSALLTLVRPEWRATPALLASAGALLFFLSDTFLAWNKFVAPLPAGRLRVRVTYHLGQALILLGAVLHFLKA